MFEIGGKKIPSSLAEVVDPQRAALLIWDMEYAIGPNAFNYKEMLPKLQELSAQELKTRLQESRDDSFKLKFQHATNPLKNPMVLRTARRQIATILTLLRQKEKVS